MRILAIGPHPDDVELGCFGTLSKLSKAGHEIHILVLTKGEASGDVAQRENECIESSKLISATLHFGNLIDTKISDGIETISVIKKYVDEINPDIVFSPSSEDTHQDHRNVSKAIISCTRSVPEIYFYETPSTSRKFYPNVFFDVTDSFDSKLKALRIHASQDGKSYMAESALEGLANFRGFDISLNGRKIEAFEAVKILNK